MNTRISKTGKMLFGQMKQVFNLGLFVGKEEFRGGQMRHIIIMLLFEGGRDSQS